MQTLTAGSFLHLENASTIEALRFTACRLAEYSGSVVAENLTAASLENLANSLWEKAEYLTLDVERRRLQQIFVENFSERFRELKPSVSTIENAGSEEQSPAPEIIERGGSEYPMLAENVSSSDSAKESAPEVEEKKDEFLGFVKSGEPFGEEASIAEMDEVATATAAMTETGQTIAQAANELAAETSKPENQSVASETPNSDNKLVADEAKPLTENPDAAKSQTSVAATAAESNPPATSAVKNSTQATAADAVEPFEFGKCTINLNLVLLPCSGEGRERKVIVSATSHKLPPEIDFLEITEGEDWTQIAGLVRDKLARFKQTLPVKYIEQLRASKNKSVKKPATTKATTADALSQPAINKANAEKESGEQKAQRTNSIESEKPQHEAAAEKGNSAASTTVATPTVQQSVAANSIQGSLF